MIHSARLVLAAAALLVSLGETRAGLITGMSLHQQPVQLPEGIAEISQAIERFKARDYEQCQVLLKSAAENHPNLPPARLIFAKLCLRLNQPAMGREALELAAVEHPNLPEIYLLFGRLALLDKHLTDAQLQFDRALALAVSGTSNGAASEGLRVEAHSGFAFVAEQRKHWPSAAANLNAWLKLQPQNGEARERLAEVLFHQGQREQARVELEQAVKDDPRLEPAAIALGRLYTEAGDPEMAARWMHGAVKAAPGDPKAHLAYASWLFEYGDPMQARAETETVTRLDPGNIQAKGLRGLIARYVKELPTAERIFEEMHRESPDKFAASNLLALCLAESPTEERLGRAWKLAQTNAQRHPNSAQALTTLGWVAHRMGHADQAERSLRAAMATGKGTSETAYYLARVLADRRKNDEVRQWLKLSLSAPGRFIFRKDAQAWLDQLNQNQIGGAAEARTNAENSSATISEPERPHQH